MVGTVAASEALACADRSEAAEALAARDADNTLADDAAARDALAAAAMLAAEALAARDAE